MAEVQAVKVERSRARGHVASNTLTAWTVAIHWRARFCLSPPALSNIHTQSLTKSTLTTLRFFEASAHMNNKGKQVQPRIWCPVQHGHRRSGYTPAPGRHAK